MNKILKRITLLALSATLVLTLIFTAGQTTNISAEETKVYTTTINSGDVTSQPLALLSHNLRHPLQLTKKYRKIVLIMLK
ncbi:hypothetical protein [Erysipelothrix anatis]|uniref:hypothetical protein n=1 Tax=Erysipelothrix anatis TaxID=2683713 RepID=UPI00140C93D1|nr:hypothetical protein [Erysipelothrix anatis]